MFQDAFQSMVSRAAELLSRFATREPMALAIVVAIPIAIAIIVAWARESLLRQR
jgi:hypothetical protein